MYIDPMIGIVRYEEHVREAEERIARLRALEERRRSDAEPRPARPARGLRRLLPRHTW
ncbi:hypothetical protein [Microbacterium marinilacus]|uniref:Uncharacterized protein n=1 Tax=Microbacterium marinilacus TaxID=415209 RepID=A0ABP7B3R2_9MICO|nr:hypothetical protein [Microbacterium marinilacus]MBY0688537.1 hypothetical protein [Microbacterium marinilacus]